MGEEPGNQPLRAILLFLLIVITGSVTGFLCAPFMVDATTFHTRLAVCLARAVFWGFLAGKFIGLLDLYNRILVIAAVVVGIVAAEYLRWNAGFVMSFIPAGLATYDARHTYNYFANLGYVFTVMKELVLSPQDFWDHLAALNYMGMWDGNLTNLWVIMTAETAAALAFPIRAILKHTNFADYDTRHDIKSFFTVNFKTFEVYEREEISAGNFEFLRHKDLADDGGKNWGAICVYLSGLTLGNDISYQMTEQVGVFNVTQRSKKVKYKLIGKKINLSQDRIEDLKAIIIERMPDQTIENV